MARELSLRLEWITDVERFAAVADRWDLLAGVAGTPFMLHCWLADWWSAFAAGREMAVCVAWDGDELVAGLPLVRGGQGALEAMTNGHSPEFQPLAADGDALRAVIAEAAAAGAMVLDNVVVSDDLRAAFAAVPRQSTTFDVLLSAPRVVIDGDYADYVAPSRRLRKVLPRLGRRLAEAHDLRESFVVAPVDLERELEEGFAVEASGWKGRTGTAILSSPVTAGFYRRIARTFAARGELRLSSMYADDRLIAWEMAILHGRRLYPLKTGFDEAMSAYGPGNLLSLRSIERCHELGLETYELGPGEEEYKDYFANDHRPLHAIRSHRVELRTMHHVAWSALRPYVRRAYRRLRRRR